MSVVTAGLMVSLDGYAAGVNQRLEQPFGDGPTDDLKWWVLEDADANPAEAAASLGADAYIMGSGMWSPGGGPHDEDWRGWWGEEPPYHAPVFVLSHHERERLTLADTTFTFVTSGIHEALALAKAAAGDGRIHVAGGAQTVNQYLAAGLIDELHLHVAPVVLGAGSRMFDGVPAMRLEQISGRVSRRVTHLAYRVLHDEPAG